MMTNLNHVRRISLIALKTSVVLLLSAALGGVPRVTGAQASSNEVGIAPVLVAVHDALVESVKYQQPGFPNLTSVTIALATDTSKDASGKVKLVIVTIGGGPSSEAASTVTVQMKPPVQTAGSNIQGVNPATLKTALAGAIIAAQEAFNEARQINNEIKTNLRTNKVQVEVKFTVKKQVQGGVDTATLLPIGLSASGTYSKSQIQTITLAYGE